MLFFLQRKGFVYGGSTPAPAGDPEAKEKAAGRGTEVNFLILDALDVTRLNRKFDTVTDSGLFHTLSDAGRPGFVDNLAAILYPGGNFFVICFGDLEPPGYGSRRIAKKEIQDSFRDGWTINYIRPAVFESRTRTEGPPAWLSSISKKKWNVCQ